MLYDDSTASQTYELYGPKEYSTEEISEMVDREIYKKRRHLNIPKAMLKPIAEIANRVVWWNFLSADEVEREFINQEIDKTAKTFKDLGIEPGDISNFTYHYLVRHPTRPPLQISQVLTPVQQGFRSSAYYDLPPASAKERREERKYLHVLDDQ